MDDSPFSTSELPDAQQSQPESAIASDDPFSTTESKPEPAAEDQESAIEVGDQQGEDVPGDISGHHELEQAGEVLESFLEVGDLGEGAMDDTAYDAIDTSEVLLGDEDDSEEEPEYQPSGKDEGMVEFFVEDDDGQIERVETRATEEPAPKEVKEEKPALEPPPPPPRKFTGEETVEMLAMDFSEEPPAEERPIVQASADKPKSAAANKPPKGARWRDPNKGPKRRILASEQDAKPSSGIIYHIALILIGAGGIASNFIDLGAWQFDPVWSGALIFFGLIGFFIQNLSGLYVSGFFTLFYGFGLFSRQQANIENGVLGGIWHLSVLFAIGFLFLLVYYILMNRKRGHFVIQEGQGQSMTALLVGLAALLTGVFGHMAAQSLPSLGQLVYMGTPLDQITYYAGVTLTVIIQSAVAAAAVAFGFSAIRVRNRGLLLAGLGIIMGFIVFGLLYAQMVMGEVQIPLPF